MKMMKQHKIYLASQSPRRRELLAGMGFEFEVMPTHVEESYPDGLTPVQVAEYLSQLKLSTLNLNEFPDNSLFIACDTIVVLGSEILGKPANEADARRMLRELSGKEHTVVSGLTLRTKSKSLTDHRCTQVKFRQLTDSEINYYIEHYKPFDKAGAYGVQEWIGYVGIESINGSYFNVMGLPTQLLWRMMNEI